MKVAFSMSIRKITKYSLLLFSFISIVAQADSVITVGVAPHGGYVILGGSVIPLKEVTLSAQMPGRVVSIAGDEGDRFKAGTVLLKLNNEDLLAKKTAVEAQLASAKDAVQNARVQYNRELWSPRVYNPRPMSGMAMPSMFDSFFNRNSFLVVMAIKASSDMQILLARVHRLWQPVHGYVRSNQSCAKLMPSYVIPLPSHHLTVLL